MYKYTVYKNELITPTLRLLTLVCKEGSKPLLHEPGQYVAISLHDKLRPTATRCFSVTSSPAQQRFIQLGIRVSGAYTSALERLGPGDLVALRGPFGSFTLKPHLKRNLVLLAGGIGISPFMSMVRYSNDLHLNNELHLIYSSRDQNEIAFLDELNAIEQTNPHFKTTHVLAGGSSDHMIGKDVLLGRLDNSSIDSLGLDYKKQTFMICGPGPYIKAITSLLKKRGVPDGQILSEAFSQGSDRQTEKLVHWPANAYALSGLALLVSSIFVMATDINKTLPLSNTSGLSFLKEADSDKLNTNTAGKAQINSIAPQIDTNTSSRTIIKYLTGSTNQPAVTQTPSSPTKTPQPQTVTPAPQPRTTVS